MSDDHSKQELEDRLRKNAMRGEWEKVVAEYEKAPDVAQWQKLDRWGNTALHLAVIDNNNDIVERLVKLIICRPKEDFKELLNDGDNNPLHLAAKMGNVRMCHDIASVREEFVNMRNKDEQTPLFLAALHGNKKAFYYLYYFCRKYDPRDIASNCRAKGDTVLHCALKNEQFDLAFQLIDMNKEAQNWVDGQGLRPLHVLASKPTSFKSGSNIRGWQKIVYHCTFVNQLKPRSIEILNEEVMQSMCEAKTTSSHFPINYKTCVDFFKWLKDIFLVGSTEIKKIQKKKKKHTWSVQVMDKLLESAEPDKYVDDGSTPTGSTFQTDKEETVPYHFVDGEIGFSHDLHGKLEDSEKPKDDIDTPMLLAAKHGVIEIVRGMYKRFPLAIRDTGKHKKNVVLLAAEYRQPDVYMFLLKEKKKIKSQFREVDHEGNSALHLAATAMNPNLWHITGVALQMQWEVKWYKYVKKSMPFHFFAQYNNKGKTAKTIFHETHMDLMKKSGDWLTQTSKSCSVVGTLILTVALTSTASIPGGFDNRDGAPLLEKQQPFLIFAVFSLIALCLSSTSVIMFLAILTYRFDAHDFKSKLPLRLFIGFSSLFFSIISMLISFCAGHYFLIDHHLQNVAVLLYTLIFLPVVLFFLVSKLPLFIDVLQTIFKIMPRRSADVDLLAAQNPFKPFQKGKFEVTSILVENSDQIFTPTAQGSYPVIFFLPGCVQSDNSNFPQLLASHGFVIVATQFNVMPPTSKMNKTESTSQVKTRLASDREMVEAELSKLTVVNGGETKFSLTFGQDNPSNPFSVVIGFDPEPGTKFSIPEPQVQTQAPQSSNISSPIVESQFVISKLCGTVKLF